MLGIMSVMPGGAHPTPQSPHAQDPSARERAFPAPPLRGPSAGRWRGPVIWAVTLAFLAIPLLVVTLRAVNGLAGWMLLIYLMAGIPLQVLGGLAVGLSLLMLPRVNTVHERRSGIRLGAPLTALLVLCWVSGVLGPGIFPDMGDAPDSEAALPLAEQIWGYDLAAEITSVAGLALMCLSVLCGLAAVLLCLVRRLRAPADGGEGPAAPPRPHGDASIPYGGPGVRP